MDRRLRRPACNTQQVERSATATTTFTATASNAGGTSHQDRDASRSRTGGGGGPDRVPGFLNTNVYTATWPFTANGSVPMGPLDAAVVKFTTGSSAGYGQISMTNAPNANATTTHDYTLSDTALRLHGTRQDQPEVQQPAEEPTFRFSVSNGPNIQLQPNTTYYINIRNSDAHRLRANGGSCDIYPINLQGP